MESEKFIYEMQLKCFQRISVRVLFTTKNLYKEENQFPYSPKLHCLGKITREIQKLHFFLFVC